MTYVAANRCSTYTCKASGSRREILGSFRLDRFRDEKFGSGEGPARHSTTERDTPQRVKAVGTRYVTYRTHCRPRSARSRASCYSRPGGCRLPVTRRHATRYLTIERWGGPMGGSAQVPRSGRLRGVPPASWHSTFRAAHRVGSECSEHKVAQRVEEEAQRVAHATDERRCLSARQVYLYQGGLPLGQESGPQIPFAISARRRPVAVRLW